MSDGDGVVGGMVPENCLMDVGPSIVGKVFIPQSVKMNDVFSCEEDLISALPEGTAVVSIFPRGKFVVYSSGPLDYSDHRQAKVLKANEHGARHCYGDNVVVCKK